MSIKPGLRDLGWLAGGALLFAAVVVGFTLAYDDRPAAEQLAAQARRLELVDRMRVELATASEAVQAAVVAVSDEESQALAVAAGKASTAVAAARDELARLIDSEGPHAARQPLADFETALAALRSLDEELLGLAVRHTNLKAYALLYGAGTQALDELRAGLDRLAAEAAVAPAALGAEVAALRIQSLLAPHVAEESDARMDDMEAQMEELAAEVGRDLDGLRARPGLAGSEDLRAADAAWARYRELQRQVVGLSRENTNVRSLAITLDRRRKLLPACTSALDALRQAIADEPMPGATHGPPPRPR